MKNYISLFKEKKIKKKFIYIFYETKIISWTCPDLSIQTNI